MIKDGLKCQAKEGGGNQRFLRAHERFLLKKIVFRGGRGTM